MLLRHAERIVAGMEAAWADVRAVASGEAGEIRVGTYQSVGARILPDVMRDFVAERPGVEVVLHESGSDQELLDLLERGELDLAFSVLPLPAGPFEAVELLSIRTCSWCRRARPSRPRRAECAWRIWPASR